MWEGKTMKHCHNDCCIIDRVYTILFILLLTLSAESFITAKALADYANNEVISGQIVIAENMTKEYSDARITFNNSYFNNNTAIIVKNGATLTIRNSLFDLSNIGNNTAVKVEKGGTLIIDNSEVSGANGDPYTIGDGYDFYTYGGYFVVTGGTMRIINGSVFQNNANISYYGPFFYKFAHNIIVVYDGNLDIIDSSYKENTGGYCTHIKAINTRITIENSQITNNIGAAIFNIYKSSLSFRNSEFSDNKISGSNGYPGGIYAHASYIDLYENNVFKNTSVPLFIIAASRLNIEKGNLFEKNSFAIKLRSASIVQIDGSEFNSNGSDINTTVFSSLKITNTKFTGNRFGPAVFDMVSKGEPFTDMVFSLPGTIDEEIKKQIIIRDSEFTNNAGGAIYLGDDSDFNKRSEADPRDGLTPVIIENTKFIGNSAVRNEDSETIKGGAIYLGNTVHAHVKNLLVTENDAANGGNGLFVDQYGMVIINPRQGAMIIGNQSENSTEKDDIRVLDSETKNMFSEKMLNGGFHHWSETGRFTNTVSYYQWELKDRANIFEICGDDEDCEVYDFCREFPENYKCEDGWVEYYDWGLAEKEVNGFSLVSRPDLLTLPEGNIVLVQGNSAAAAEGKSAYGGGIAVNGILEVGEPGVTVSVRKVWNVEGDAIPTPEEFLPMLKLTANGQSFPTGEIRQLSQTDEDGKTVTVFSIENDPWVTIRVTDAGDKVYEVLYEDLPAEIGGEAVIYSVTEESSKYEIEQSGDMEQGFEIVNTLKEEEEQTWFRFIENGGMLPRTGFSALNPQELPQQGAEISYKASGLTLQIPSLSVTAEIVTVPAVDEDYPVEWLGGNAGLLEGSSEPGKGVSIIAAHNHLNTTEAGPFALLSELEAGDVLFVLDRGSQYRSFRVYASEKIGENDTAALRALAEEAEDPLLLITCEDERPEGGYANRRIVAASPM